MNKILARRVFRNLKNNFVRYFALFLLIVMGMYLVVSLIASADTIINGVNPNFAGGLWMIPKNLFHWKKPFIWIIN